MILRVNYEELQALRWGAHAILGEAPGWDVAVAVVPEDRERVAALPPLDGDLSVSTLGDARRLEEAVRTICEALRAQMDTHIVASHPASESAVASYFDYAHVVAVLGRLGDIRAEMEALIEVVTGAPATPELAETFQFPD